MEIITWLIIGGIAGWLASLVLGTDARQGWLMNIVLGMIGAVVGGLLMNFFGAPGVTGFNLYSLLVAVVGAVIVVWLARFVYR